MEEKVFGNGVMAHAFLIIETEEAEYRRANNISMRRMRPLNLSDAEFMAHYTMLAATSGEGTSLTLQERKTLVEAWARVAKETKQHLMVQVGGAPFPDVVDLARHADTLRVDSILTMPELYFKPKTSQELVTYLKFVSAAAPSTPLLYYHNPDHTGVKIDMAEFLEQASGQIPNLKGIKYTSNNLAGGYGALKAAEGKYTVFIGGDYVFGNGVMAHAFLIIETEEAENRRADNICMRRMRPLNLSDAEFMAHYTMCPAPRPTHLARLGRPAK